MSNDGVSLATGLVASLVILSFLTLGVFAVGGGVGFKGGDLAKAVQVLGKAPKPIIGAQRPQSIEAEQVEQRGIASTGSRPADKFKAIKPVQSVLLGSDEETRKHGIATKPGRSKRTAKPTAQSEKIIAEWATPKSRVSKRGGGRGRLGLFALSGDFGRPVD